MTHFHSQTGAFTSEDMTHFHSQTGTFTAIDVPIYCPNALLDFSCQVFPDLYGSYHFPIVKESTESILRLRLPRWCLGKANWKRFTELSSPDLSIDDFIVTDEAARYYTDLSHSSALQCVRRTSGHFPRRPVPWWNSNSSVAVRAKRVFFALLRRHRGCPQCLDDFRRARAHARWVLKKVRRDSWKAYVSFITTKTPFKQVWTSKCGPEYVKYLESFLSLHLQCCTMLGKWWLFPRRLQTYLPITLLMSVGKTPF